MTAKTTKRWRRGLAAAAALTLPLTVAACGDDETDEPDIIEEDVTPEETPAPGTDEEGPETPEPGTGTDEGGTGTPEGDLLEEDDQ